MTSLRKTLLAGVAAIGIGDRRGAASAQNAHVMTVPVPGGGVAQIRYIGDVPPQIVFVPAPAAFDAWMPVSSVFGHESPFAMLDRIAAEMDRRAAAMFRYAEAMADRADAGGFAEAAIRAPMPPGGESYSYVSTISGNGVCTQSVRITSRGDGTPPRSSGTAPGIAARRPRRRRVGRGSAGSSGPVGAAEAARSDPDAGQRPSPYTGMVRQVASTAR